MPYRITTCSCVIALLVATASAAHGSLIFSDTTFDPANWNNSVVAYFEPGSELPTGTLTQEATGGNPGAYGLITLDRGNGGSNEHLRQFYTPVGSGATWDPATQGPITSVSYSLDAITLSGPVGGTPVFVIAVRQGNFVYTTEFPSAPGETWTTISATDLTAADFNFQRIDATDPLAWNVDANPDFSVNGAPLQFGFLMHANTGSMDLDGFRTSGVDNFWLQVIPEPASMSLLVAGGLLMLGRRRKTASHHRGQ